MQVKITTYRNPFSFFCVPAEVKLNPMANVKDIWGHEENNYCASKKFDFSGVLHGQYVAVLWNDHWARGIITLETQFLIWLVDYGIYLRPTEKTVYVNLPAEDKRYPTKVFEASLYGITPVDKVVTEMCEIKNEVTMTWCNGGIEKAQNLIASAHKIYFIPVAMLSTKINDVVIGDLYLQIKGQRIVNLKDALEEWPVFLNKDSEVYVEKLSKFYTYRRQHRASLIKPAIPDLPTITSEITFAEYTAICDNAPELELSECDQNYEEGSTLTYLETVRPPERNTFKPTPEEMEKYSSMYIMVSGREYNVLNVMCNKARDLYMCDKYADQKYIGRATSRSCRSSEDHDESIKINRSAAHTKLTT